MSFEKLDEGIKARAIEANKTIDERAELDREVTKSVKKQTSSRLATLKTEFEKQRLPVLEKKPPLTSAMEFAGKFLKETGYQDANTQERERILDGMGAESIDRFDALTLRETPATIEQTERA